MHPDKHYTVQARVRMTNVNQTAMEMYRCTSAIESRETSRPRLQRTDTDGKGKWHCQALSMRMSCKQEMSSTESNAMAEISVLLTAMLELLYCALLPV